MLTNQFGHQFDIPVTQFRMSEDLRVRCAQLSEQIAQQQHELAKARMALAFNQQRYAGWVMQYRPPSAINGSDRVMWAQIQRESYQIILQQRQILSETSWATKPRHTWSAQDFTHASANRK